MKIRKAMLDDAKPIAFVHVESWKTTYEEIVPSSYLQQLSVTEKEQLWQRGLQQDKHYIFVVEEDGNVCGFISGGRNRATQGKESEYEGEIYAIYLLKEAQRKGYGKELVKTLVKDFVNDGIRSMTVWVLEENHSKHFYEHLGGKVVNEAIINIGGKELKEVCYGWNNIKDLL
jgi:ribosomal protein S18 acetylase RimI-like enzyme